MKIIKGLAISVVLIGTIALSCVYFMPKQTSTNTESEVSKDSTAQVQKAAEKIPADTIVASDSATATPKNLKTEKTLPPPTLTGNWILLKLNGKEIDSTRYMKGRPNLEIAEGDSTFNGTTGCNSMHGQLKTEGSKILFEKISTTKMMCKGSGEKEFLNVLRSASTFKLTKWTLVLNAGKEQLLFVRPKR